MKTITINKAQLGTNSIKTINGSKLNFRIGRQAERIFFIVSGLFGWSLLLAASYYHEMLFFSELLVSSFIIWCVIVLRFIQPTSTEWIDDQKLDLKKK